MLLYGELGDRAGPRYCFGVGACLSWFGFILLATSARVGMDVSWYAATFFMGASGPGVFMGCLFLGEKYPQLHAVISAVAASMWDASALVLMLFNLVYFSGMQGGEATAFEAAAGSEGGLDGVSLHTNSSALAGYGGMEHSSIGLGVIAISWLLLCVPIGLRTFRELPTLQETLAIRSLAEQASTGLSAAKEEEKASLRDRSGTVEEDVSDNSPGAAPPMRSTDEAGKGEEGEESGGNGDDGPTFRQCFCRTDTLLILYFMATYNLKSSFFITTFADEAASLFDSYWTDTLATTFNLAFPLGGFVTSVFATILLSRLGDREDLYMLLVVLMALFLSFLNLLPYPSTQLFAALLFGPTRTLQWACYFHFLSLPKRYPPQFVGRLLGYGNLVIALAGDVPVSMLNAFVSGSDAFGSTAARYVAVHAFLQLLLVGGLALPWHLRRTRHVGLHEGSPLAPDA